VPVGVGGVAKVGVMPYPGVVHQDVDRTDLLVDLIGQRLDLLFAGDVDDLGDDPGPRRLELSRNRAQARLIDIDHDEVAPLLGQEEASLLSDAACGARE
jgi:hypothetical protein